MPFFIQYDLTTGLIQGTVTSLTAPGPMPDGRGQLQFADNVLTDNKIVDLTSGALVDLPPVT